MMDGLEFTRMVLHDKKKVIITEATIRDALRLDDAEVVECLPNEEIFAELARMGYEKPSTKLTFYKAFFSSQWKFLIHTILQCMSAKRTSWNEFSLSMASAVICLSTGDLSSHTTKYSSPALTQKVFANMRRVGKGCSGVETPLFKGMIVEQLVGEGADEVHDEGVPTAGDAAEGAASAVDDEVPAAINEPSIPSPTPPTLPPKPSQDQPSTSQDAGISMDLLQNLLDICTTLTRRVEHLEQDKIAQDLEITKLKQRVKTLEIGNKLKVLKLRKLKKVGTTQKVETSDDTVMDDVSKQERMIADMDADVDVTLKDVALNDKIDEAQIYQIDLEHADKVLSMQDDKGELAELQKVVEVVTTAKLITKVVIAASATITAAAPQLTTVAAPTLTTAPSAARRRKGVVIRDPEESATPSIIIHTKAKSKDKGKGILVEELKPLKKQAQIEQDEAYARELEEELNKNIDWDETKAQARKNMMIYLRNVARFKMDYFKGMTYDDIRLIFEKYFNFNLAFLQKTKERMDEEDSRALKRSVHGQAKVKSWKMLESCGVQIITFTTTQLILLVERRYPLTRFTLNQLINNVRLEVKEESEVSLELLRFIRQQQQEGFRAE
nr:hypothetical protein [Tanacetum cinerariifolium]